MFEARAVGHEFVTTPCLWFSRGESQAKLLGSLSLVRFFGLNKEMNKYFYYFPNFGLCRYDKSEVFNFLFEFQPACVPRSNPRLCPGF